MIREPIANGQFYPSQSQQINDFVKELSLKKEQKISAKGIILPHAGYIYSGKVAATTINAVLPRKTIIILGPNHTGEGETFSLWPQGKWLLPAGPIGIDSQLAGSILGKGDFIVCDESAHINEHSIEVELPLLKYFFGDFEFVPICCKISDKNSYEKVATQIFEAIKNIKNDVLLIASTDLTHYEPESSARKKDRAVIEAIINLDEAELLNKVDTLSISMCGVAPVAILILVLKKIGAKKSVITLYETSAEVSKDSSSVVGYAGVVIK